MDPQAPVLVLLWLVTKEYGEECYHWEPEVLRMELDEDFSCEITDLQSDKIQAGITILTTELYETDIAVFETLNYLLNHQPDDLDTFNPMEAEELICGLTEAYLIKAEEIDFSPETRVYAGMVFYDYGMHRPPTLFPRAIMEEKEGDDTEKNAALQELFDEKLRITKEYLEQCTHITTKTT